MLGMYRGLYILNWVYRYHSESFFDPIAVVAGVVQTVLYIDFFYLYVTKGLLIFNFTSLMQFSAILFYRCCKERY